MQKLLAASLFLSAFAGTAVADQPITVTGCVAKGVEAGCLILRTVPGKIYNITAAKPAPVPGSYGTVKGTLKSDGVSNCQQGKIIDPAKWTMKGKVCPKGKRSK